LVPDDANREALMNEKRMRLLAIMEIAGGLLAILGIALDVGLAPQLLPPWNIPLATIFALLAISAGVLLLARDSRGIPLSLLTQGLQIVSISAGGRYTALAGIKISIVIASTGAALLLEGGGAFHLSTSGADGSFRAAGTMIEMHIGTNAQLLSESTFTVGINFVAIYLVTRLLAMWFAQKDAETPV
jgi:hypothetical protein